MASRTLLFLLLLLPLFFFFFSSLHLFAWLPTHSLPSHLKSSKRLYHRVNSNFLDLSFWPVVQLSWHPRVFLHKRFLSYEECDHLISLAKDKMEKSMVVDDDGKSILNSARTSSGMFLMKGQDEIIRGIEKRIAAWTFLPEENGEHMQILHYEDGQKYEPHLDAIDDRLEPGGQRVATVLMYLSNVKKGGETVFPDSVEKFSQQLKDDSLSECGKKGFAVKPEKGDALLFFSLYPNGTIDEYSLHESCPVIEGEKWSATKWIRIGSMDQSRKHRPPSDECKDLHPYCKFWSEIGQCKLSAPYMIGSEFMVGHCRKSCKACN